MVKMKKQLEAMRIDRDFQQKRGDKFKKQFEETEKKLADVEAELERVRIRLGIVNGARDSALRKLEEMKWLVAGTTSILNVKED